MWNDSGKSSVLLARKKALHSVALAWEIPAWSNPVPVGHTVLYSRSEIRLDLPLIFGNSAQAVESWLESQSTMGDAKGDEASKAIEDSPFPLTDTDRWVLSQTDEEFHLHDWDGLKEIIGR